MSDFSVRRVSVLDARPGKAGFQAMALAGPQMVEDAALPVLERDAYALGYEAGEAAAAARHAKDREELLSIVAAMEVVRPEASDALAALIAESVGRLVTDIVGAEPTEPDTLNARVREAAGLIAEADAPRAIRLHPDDVALIDGVEFAIPIIGDPALPRGSVEIATAMGSVEHGTRTCLEALRVALGQGEITQ